MSELLPLFVAFLVVAASPGPANIAVAAIALRKGQAAAMRFGIGLGCGLAVWGIVAATGLGAILQSSAIAFTVLKVFGGVYLLWLAFQSARSATHDVEKPVLDRGHDRWLWRGLILNLSNPKAIVAWMAALSMGLSADGQAGVLVVATGICILIGFANYAVHAIAFSRARVMAAYASARRWIDGAVAGVFALAGLGLLRSALQRTP
ncbi:MAG: LysE family translocator [Pseudomonadota bacterium]